MGPRSFQIRIWGPKRWPTPTKSGAPCNFCFIKFLPKCTAEAPETPCTPFMHPVPGGGGGYCVETPQEPSHPQGPPTCQISSISVRSLDFYREYTYTMPPCPPWGAQIKKQKNTRLIKFDYREILFYKYCTILKKNFYPPPGPPSTPATLDPGAKSKIFLHHFVRLVKCFPKWYDMIR